MDISFGAGRSVDTFFLDQKQYKNKQNDRFFFFHISLHIELKDSTV